MENAIKGKVWKFGHDINTALVIPNFAVLLPRTEQPQHCFNANRPGWVDEVKPGDILIAGRNFGVGSARNIGDVFMQLGISVIIAESFNGLGLRNCVNIGLPSLPCKGILEAFEEGDVAEVDWIGGEVRNTTRGTSVHGQPIPKALQDIIVAGGVDVVLRKEGFLSDSSLTDRR
jgi:3-isopropylmalate/(R)-2-methylmalate dehydratase small subunit